MYESPLTASPEKIGSIRELSSSLAGAADVSIVIDGGDGIPLPASVREGLERMVDRLADGLSVLVYASEEWLTTQEAADFLGVSRPHLIDLIEREGFQCIRSPGRATHRRVALRDLATFRARRQVQAQLDASPDAAEGSAAASSVYLER